MSHPKIPNWSPRIKPEKIHRLYESDARGLLDEDLLDEVGYGLFSRCQDILVVSEAVRGRVRCLECGQIILRKEAGKEEEKQEILTCGNCSWQVTWEDYHKSFQGLRLFAGQADDIFSSFIIHWEAARSPQAKLIAIDTLIHEFHLYLQKPGRPIAVNVIQGKMKEVFQLINDLAYGPGSTPGLQEQKEAWDRKLETNLCYPARM